TLEKTVPPSVVYAHCYIGMANVQDSPQAATPYLEKAEKVLADVAKTKPELDELRALRANVGWAYEITGREGEAVTVLEAVQHELLSNKPINFWELNAPYSLANAYAKSGKTSEALALYRKLMTKPMLKTADNLPAAKEGEAIYKSLGG